MRAFSIFFLCLSCFLISSISFGQDISFSIGFDTTKIEVKRQKSDFIVPLKLINKTKNLNKDSLKLYQCRIKVNGEETTIINAGYKIYFKNQGLDELDNEKEFFIKIKKDTIPDRKRKLVLDIEILKNDTVQNKINDAKYKRIEIIFNSYKESLSGYKYLAYVGTNFDLVEGINAKDLFFATNVFSEPEIGKNRNVGFYLSIYGNRAFTQTDSAGSIRRETKFTAVTDSTTLRTRNTNYFVNKRVTDNIGAYISPLIRLKIFKSRNINRKINLYYSPSLEFVYRRTNLSYTDLNIGVSDTLVINQSFEEVISNPDNERESLNLPLRPLFSQTFNEYSFNAGVIGLFLSLENEKISVRVHGSVGYSSNYNRTFSRGGISDNFQQQSDIFFSGRAWVTDSKTGITLQAEVTNTANNPRPFFAATLSKAFNFKKIGDFFQPIIKD